MFRTSLYPLRTVVGPAIPLGKKSSIRKVFESRESEALGMRYDFDVKPSLSDTINDSRYRDYLPRFEGPGENPVPGEGMDTLPLPPRPRPFAPGEQLAAFFALSKADATEDVSRKLSVRFSIELPEKFLVGGICYGGFPYLPYARMQTEAAGQISSNFGLPREVRLSCIGGTSQDVQDTSLVFEYLDSEISTTKQHIVSHSGFHYLCIDPTLTNIVTVHFSDYPTILRRLAKDSDGKPKSDLAYGFIIPYFYLFEYREGTRYHPAVSAGILGTRATTPDEDVPFQRPIDHRHIESYPGSAANYYDFTAASVFGQQRDFTIREDAYDGKKPKGKVVTELEECFISEEVKPGKSVILYVEQAEEYERCLSGLKLFLPFIPKLSLERDLERITVAIRELYPSAPDFAEMVDGVPREDLEKVLREILGIPEKINFCEKVGIRVYELDPLEGVSPLKVPLNGRFATLLAERQIDELTEISLALFLEGIRFVRPSTARCFAIELTNRDEEEAGQFVIKRLQLVQSAHVSVHPRAAKSVQVSALHFRLVGAELAEDYATLGREGFNFSIEHVVAGERKSVLFRANSLLDLLHAGAARIFSNVRRRGVEFEKSEIYPVFRDDDQVKYQVPGEFDTSGGGLQFSRNYEERRTESRLEGWRRSETGQGISGRNSWTGRKQPGAFANLGNQELRTLTSYVYPRLRNDDNERTPYSFMRQWFNQLKDVMVTTGIGDEEQLIPNPGATPLIDGFEDVWTGLVVPPVIGLKQLLSSPYGLYQFSKLQDFLENPTQQDLLDLIGNHQNPLLLPLAGGINTGVSYNAGVSLVVASLGAGMSLGFGFFPMLSHQTTVGNQGLITKQASRSGFSYSQHLNNSYDEGDSYTELKAGETKRVVTHKAVPDTDRERLKGAEVLWQGGLADIITGSIPLNLSLPATATRMQFRTSDDSLRVRFGSGVGKSVSADFWFDVTEEAIKDDY